MNPLPGRRIFISYSHRGKGPEWKAALLRALQVFEQQHLLDVWEDGKIRVSSYWEDDIERAMDEAALAVVLLTPEALQSEFILAKELPRLRDRQRDEHLPVFPVICEDCDWRAHDWLQATQAPNGSNPLSALQPEAQERAFRQLATAIAEELSRFALGEPTGDTSPPGDDHLYLDKFPLTRGPGLREERLIGREQELALLDLAFAQPHTAIVSLVAWGGVGKTMLVQHWLRRLETEGWFGTRRVYAWSFYSQGTQEDRQASEDLFLAHALAWFGVQCEPTLSPWDKGRLLAEAVMRERTLLILDGIEPLQYPPGPMGGQLRAPGVQCLLKQLARKANSDHSSFDIRNSSFGNCLCLVTTREPLTDLADFQRRQGSPWGSVLRVDLGNLIDEAGAALLHHAGANRAGAAEIRSDDKELLAASREVDGHALTLNLLGRFLARAHSGDIRRRDFVKFEEADRAVQGGTTFKMLAAFENWFARSGEFGARQLAILRILGLFDRPADAGCIATLRKPPVIAGLTDPLFTARLGAGTGPATMQPLLDEDWNTGTSFLADFGLVVVQAEASECKSQLDSHPLIREYFAKRLLECSEESWRSAHHRLYTHLTDSEQQPNTLESLQPLYQAVKHGCLAEIFRSALCDVYWPRILRGYDHYSWKRVGAAADDLTALSGLYTKPWSQPVEALSQEESGMVLHQSALCLRATGRLTEAVDPLLVALANDTRRGAWNDAAMSACLLAEIQVLLGDVAAAIRNAERSVIYADKNDWDFYWVANRSGFADALHQAGRSNDALTLFKEAETIQARREPLRPILYSLGGLQYNDALLSDLERTAWYLCLKKRIHQPVYRSHSASTDVGTARHDSVTEVLVRQCGFVKECATLTLKWSREVTIDSFSEGFDLLTLGRAALIRAVLDDSAFRAPETALVPAWDFLHSALNGLRRSNFAEYVVRALIAVTWLRYLCFDLRSGCADLDEAWDIAERGPMRLHLADIHLHRARLFFREKHYPWESPQADLAAAEKLINECGYHRRDVELADAKKAILGANA